MLFNNKEKVFETIIDLINQSTGLVVIQAGHFALIHNINDNTVVPAIYQDIEDGDIKKSVEQHPYMGSFPMETWLMGVSLAKEASKHEKSAKLILLVNDWQWVKKSDFGEDNLYRVNFFNSETLPVSFARAFNKAGLDERAIVPFKTKDGKINSRYFWSEMRLRSQYSNHFATICPIDNQCAQEHVPLLVQLAGDGVKLFVNFIPKTCRSAIIVGSRATKENYGLKDFKIVNIFANGIYRDDFWEETEIVVI